MNAHYTRLIDSQISLAMERAEDAQELIHKGLRGRAREIFIRDLLRPFINPNFGICTGVVVDSEGGQSSQIDIIIYDKTLLPPILLTAEEGIIPCESTLATIEIKSKLTSEELRKSVQNARSVKALRPQFHEPNPTTKQKTSIICSVFSYKSGRNPENESRTIQKYVREENKNNTDQIVHIPISASCIGDSAFTYCQRFDPENPSKQRFDLITTRPLATFLSYISDSTTLQRAQRSPMYSAHYLQ
jgi:Domain of unknown function (DUF6602)